MLKAFARHLNVPQTQTKTELVVAIVARSKESGDLAEIHSLSGYRQTHTINVTAAVSIRFINFILAYPDRLKRSQALASRLELQFHEIGHKQQIFVDAGACMGFGGGHCYSKLLFVLHLLALHCLLNVLSSI